LNEDELEQAGLGSVPPAMREWDKVVKEIAQGNKRYMDALIKIIIVPIPVSIPITPIT
jgi:hypothetical protein